jgi:hypothetical protein
VLRRGNRGSRVAIAGHIDDPSSVNGRETDVVLQLRQPDAEASELLCVRVPASAFSSSPKRRRFVDRAGKVVAARGLGRIVLRSRPNGALDVSVSGKKVALETALPGRAEMTLALPEGEGAWCARGATILRRGAKPNSPLKFP